MRVVVTITKELEPYWFTNEELAELPDDAIIDYVREDISAFLENANWAIYRQPNGR